MTGGPDLLAAPSGSAGGSRRRAGADPLSDVLRGVRLTGALFFRVDASWPWGLEIPPAQAFAPIILPRARHVISYHIILKGAGCARLAGEPPVRFAAGDILVFPHADAYAMACAEAEPPLLTPQETLGFFRDMAARAAAVHRRGRRRRRGRGREFVCGFLGCDLQAVQPAARGAAAPAAAAPAGGRGRGPARPADRADPRGGAAAAGRRALRAARPQRADLRRGGAPPPRRACRPSRPAGWPACATRGSAARSPRCTPGPRTPGRSASWRARRACRARCWPSASPALIGCPPMQYLARWRIQLRGAAARRRRPRWPRSPRRWAMPRRRRSAGRSRSSPAARRPPGGTRAG